ncbi:unnamed protein product [Blepharisma stoltei]|uniref:Jacalin-type lectin domain-containing protein n=1 Tax=Blepharisma stoltei TaxID=1481888 RepID=A0AAU9K097_9CILI|nr:unnamed protein product [Blepharisma stoltei]
MRLVSIRSFFRVFHSVKYTACQHCGAPLKENETAHTCDLDSIPLQFQFSHLTEKANTNYFNERMKGRSSIREITFWLNDYITGFDVKLEDIQNKKFFDTTVGNKAEKSLTVKLNNAEYITNVEYGCDFHGLFCLALYTNSNRTILIGERQRPKKKIAVPEGQGIVGIFGGFTNIIVHVGFYFDDIKNINYARHRELLLIKYKGKKPENEDGGNGILSILLEVDEYLFRYLASFV